VHRRLGIAIWLMATVLAGCSPKRVSSGHVLDTAPAPEPETVVAMEPTPAADAQLVGPPLPGPKPLGRSGTGTPAVVEGQPIVLGSRVVELAEAQLGKPYQWGAAGPDKFDCSGLVQYVYSSLGISLPRVSRQQAAAGVHVDREDLQPGDLVFFTLSGSRIDHVGIYVGHSKFIHAPRKYSPVREDTLHNVWWRRKFKGGRRLG